MFVELPSCSESRLRTVPYSLKQEFEIVNDKEAACPHTTRSCGKEKGVWLQESGIMQTACQGPTSAQVSMCVDTTVAEHSVLIVVLSLSL